MNTETLNSIVPLTVKRWQRAHAEAEDAVRRQNKQPQYDHYFSMQVGEYPAWLTNAALVLLASIALGALVISAGKQLIATHLALVDLTTYGQVSEVWLNATLLITLLVGELGALTCSFAAAMFKRRVFRYASFAMAALALVANLTVFFKDPKPDVLVYQLFLTIGAPMVVLIVGYFAEQLLLTYFKQRSEALTAYSKAVDEWKTIEAHPAQHPTFAPLFYSNVIQQLREAQSPERRLLLDDLINTEPETYKWLVLREKARHEMALIIEEPARIAERSERSGTASEQSERKPSKQVQRALDWLAEHPQIESVRKAATEAGVSATTMQTALNWGKK